MFSSDEQTDIYAYSIIVSGFLLIIIEFNNIWVCFYGEEMLAP